MSSHEERTEQHIQRVEAAGERLQRIGKRLTALVTVPIVAFVLFGWVGLAIGVAVGLVVWAAMRPSGDTG